MMSSVTWISLLCLVVAVSAVNGIVFLKYYLFDSFTINPCIQEYTDIQECHFHT